MTVATDEQPTKQQENEKQLKNVEGYTWQEVINELELNPAMFQRFGCTSQMLTDKGEKKWVKDIKQGFEGHIIFDRSFVVFKLTRTFIAMDLSDEDDVDALMNEVKPAIKEEHQKEQSQKLNEIRQRAKELGLTPDQLVDLLSS